jgi:hypothetical protein
MSVETVASNSRQNRRQWARAIAKNVGWLLVGLGYGMAWAHQLTKYPAIWGLGLIAIGGMLLLVLRAHRA